MLKICLIGYGNMGKMLERLIQKSEKMTVCSKIDPNVIGCESEISQETIKNADVCIDFSLPNKIIENIKKVITLDVNLVVGTTGWNSHKEEIEKLVEEKNIGFIFASNFSVGMNAFFKIIEDSAKLMNKIDSYDVFGYEMHHNNKADSPSGTAKDIAKIVVENTDKKKKINYDRIDRKIEENEFQLASIRAGNIPGTHLIGYDSFADSIELKHIARNRTGFAKGALLAANWIVNKKGFFDFKQEFENIIS